MKKDDHIIKFTQAKRRIVKSRNLKLNISLFPFFVVLIQNPFGQRSLKKIR